LFLLSNICIFDWLVLIVKLKNIMNRSFVLSLFFVFIGLLSYGQLIEISLDNTEYIQSNIITDDNALEITSFQLKNNVPDGDYIVYTNPTYSILYFKGSILNSKRNGKWFFYTSTGLLERDCDFSFGLKNGAENIYDINGSVIESRTYKDGLLHGPRVYYSNTSLVKKDLYLNGNKR